MFTGILGFAKKYVQDKKYQARFFDAEFSQREFALFPDAYHNSCLDINLGGFFICLLSERKLYTKVHISATLCVAYKHEDYVNLVLTVYKDDPICKH